MYPDESSGLVDEFAQTRPPDDLFDDEVTLVAPAAVVREPPQGPSGRRGGRGVRGGRGRGRGGYADGQRADETPKAVEEGAETTVEGGTEGKTPAKYEGGGSVRGDRSGTGGVKKVRVSGGRCTKNNRIANTPYL